eukprot:1149503-Prorocentrum_lima.AAC.1
MTSAGGTRKGATGVMGMPPHSRGQTLSGWSASICCGLVPDQSLMGGNEAWRPKMSAAEACIWQLAPATYLP